MPQYAILVFERETPGGIEDMPAEVMEAHGQVPDKVAATGGKILSAYAAQPSSTATTIRGERVTDGPFAESREALAGWFVVDARDLDHAIEIGRFVPIVSGGVEVRPLLGD